MSEHPAIRFCNAPDDVRLAMTVQGSGPVIVKAANWLSHLQQESELFATRHWIDELARGHTLVRYDSRGCGLSDRDVASVSLQAWVSDLESVVDAANIGRFVLFGVSQGAAVAIEYAVRHPERVQGLVLFGAFARGMLRQGGSERVTQASHALVRLAELGWGHDTASFREVFTQHIFRDATPEQMRAFDECHRHTVSGPVAARYMRTFYQLDVCRSAAGLSCPALVMHSDGDALVLPREGRLLASLIPGARFVEVPSRNHLLLESEPGWKQVQAEFRGFMAAVHAAETGAARPALTPRQKDVLKAVARGLTDKSTARELALSPRTVEMHVARALKALGVRNRAEAVSVALQWKLLD